MRGLVRVTGYALLVMALISCTSVQMDAEILNREQRVAEYLKKLTESELVGIQYVVTDKDGLLYQYAGGLSDIAAQKPMRSDTLMQTGSMCKTLTAIAILQLAEKGKLNLDDSVSAYFPNHPYGKQIAVRQLINHTAGVPNPIPTRWFHSRESHQEYDKDKTLQSVLNKHSKLQSDPGEEYNYSNLGYWLLGRIVEELSGERYQDYVLKNILEPLGMEQASFFELLPHQNTSKGYLPKYSFFNLIKGWITDDYMWTGYEERWATVADLYQNGPGLGGLITTASSTSLFLRDQLQEKSKLLGRQYQELLYQPQTDAEGRQVPMTLGWHVGDSEGVEYFFKEGMTAGFHSEMRVYPKQGIASVVLVNKMMFKTKKNLDILDREFYQTNLK